MVGKAVYGNALVDGGFALARRCEDVNVFTGRSKGDRKTVRIVGNSAVLWRIFTGDECPRHSPTMRERAYDAASSRATLRPRGGASVTGCRVDGDQRCTFESTFAAPAATATKMNQPTNTA
jgi:hypothetical protein